MFKAIHEGKPDQRLLAYQYMQMLPQIAQGDANKVWIVPSEIGKALEGIGGFFSNATAARAEPPTASRLQGRGRSSTRPAAVTRVSKDGWRAVAGPCTTVPSLITKVDPCQGQVTQTAPRSATIRP